MLANDGWNYLNPIDTCGNVAQAGAVLAVAIKALSAKTKQVHTPPACPHCSASPNPLSSVSTCAS